MRKIDLIVIHCSATDYTKQTANWIRKIHIEENGWNDIGYHYFIRHSGLIERGRDIKVVGAHASKSYNSRSIGICLAGLQHFTKEQFTSLDTLLLLLKLWLPKKDTTIVGHNELNLNKTCPNFDMAPVKRTWMA